MEVLLKAGHKVRVLDNFSTGKLANLQLFLPTIEIIEGDVNDYQTVKQASRDIRYVVHLAALASVARSVEDPSLCHNSNLNGTLNVLLAARDAGVQRMVFASSSAVYGTKGELPSKEDNVGETLSPYALTKFAGELYCRLFAEIYQVQTVCLRFFNVFGPRQDPSSQYSGVISRFLELMGKGAQPEIFGDGQQTRDFVHVNNVTTAIIRATASPNCGQGECINIGMGESRSINDLLNFLNALLGTELPARYGRPREGEVRYSRADISRARELLGYQVEVDFLEGLSMLVKE